MIFVEGEKIKAVGAGLAIPAGATVIDLSNLPVLPGLVDTHTHLARVHCEMGWTALAAADARGARRSRQWSPIGILAVRTQAAVPLRARNARVARAAGTRRAFTRPGSEHAMKIFKGIRASWRRLARGRPGSRFEGYYRSQQDGRSPARRVVSILAGLVLVAGGLVLLPAPGPGMLVVALGFGLLAREFRAVARALDWLEPNVRRAIAAAARLWRRSSPLGRAALVLLALVLGSGVALGGYRLVLAD